MIKKTSPLMIQKRASERLFFSSLTKGALIMDHSKYEGCFYFKLRLEKSLYQNISQFLSKLIRYLRADKFNRLSILVVSSISVSTLKEESADRSS